MVRSASDPLKKPPAKKKSGNSSRTSKAVGDALRDAYDRAVSETVPDEMLDLLKKLD